MIPTFTFFAVEKGNMTLVQFPNGINMLVDSRSSETRPTPLEYLKARIKALHYVVITHPHQDHLTGLEAVCRYFRPKYLWHNGRYFKPDPVYDDWTYYENLRAGRYSYCSPVAVRAGQTATIGQSTVDILGPKVPHLEGTQDDENNNGIILKISSGPSSVVLTGDSQEEQWDTLALGSNRAITVFLASHHGRESGFSQRVLTGMKPQLVVISDGEPGETDATPKYRKLTLVRTTREHTVVVRPQEVALGATIRQ